MKSNKCLFQEEKSNRRKQESVGAQKIEKTLFDTGVNKTNVVK